MKPPGLISRSRLALCDMARRLNDWNLGIALAVRSGLKRAIKRCWQWLVRHQHPPDDQSCIGTSLCCRMARVLVAIALVELLACALILTVSWWPWPPVIAVAACGYYRMKQRNGLWVYGTARWSGEDELRRAGLIGGNKGLSIGRLGHPGHLPLVPRLLSMFDPNTSSRDASERFMARLMPKLFATNGEVVRLKNAVHTAIFGPTGAGKGASFIIPWLLETDESAVVLDYKGENAAITARHREKVFGHHSVLLDPFNVVTATSDRLDPIDFILKGSPTAIDDCRDLAEQLVLRTGEEREPHWNDASEMWISGTCVAVVEEAEKENRSIQRVRDVLSNPNNVPKLIELLCQGDGMISRLGGQLAHFRDKELSSTLTSVNRHLRFLDTPSVAAITTRSSFDPGKLRDGKMTVYCIVPPEHMRAQAALIRMWIGALIRAVVRGGLQHG